MMPLGQKGSHLSNSFLIFADVEIFLNDGDKHIEDDEICNDEPKEDECCAYPGRIVLRLSSRHAVHDSGPILARQDLVHSQKRVPDGVKRDLNGVPVLV